jgi:hypothetical protein
MEEFAHFLQYLRIISISLVNLLIPRNLVPWLTYKLTIFLYFLSPFKCVVLEALFFFFFAFLKFIYSFVHTLFGPFLPPDPFSLSLPLTPSLPGRTCSALFSNFVEEKTQAIIKKKAFLLVEIRIAIQRDS